MNRILGYRFLFNVFLLISTPLFAASEDTWTEIKSPNFIVVSNASPKEARRAARSFEQFRQLVRTAMPQLKTDPGSIPRIFAVRDGKGLKALLPIREEKGAVEPSGIFMGNTETHFVALRLDVPQEQAYHTIYHEYVHMIMRLNFQQMPLWLSEGLAEFYSFAKLFDNESTLGNVSTDLLETLKQFSMMPLPVLMSVTPDSPFYSQSDKARVFYAQSWALTHYLLLGDKGAHAKRLNEFLKQIQGGVPEKEAAEQTLGDLATLQQNLRSYMHVGYFFHYRVPARLEMKEEQYAARPLSKAESLALRGQLLIVSKRLDEAKAMLEEAIRLDSRNADAHEGMGLLFQALGNPERAGEYFSAAAQLDSKNYLAQFYAAQFEYQEGSDYKAAESHLRKALQINPKFVPAVSLLAHLVSMQKERLPEALAFAAEAASLEPAELRHHINICYILIRMERYDEASRLARRVLTIAATGPNQTLADAILGQIKQREEWQLEIKRREEAAEERRRQQAKELDELSNQIREEQPQEESFKPAEVNKPVIKRGPVGKVIGVIQSVKCDYPAVMDVVLDSGGKQKTYRAENYYKVKYWAVGAPGKSGFEPCEELQGKRVQIEFQSVVGQEFSGMIQTVAIEQ